MVRAFSSPRPSTQVAKVIGHVVGFYFTVSQITLMNSRQTSLLLVIGGYQESEKKNIFGAHFHSTTHPPSKEESPVKIIKGP